MWNLPKINEVWLENKQRTKISKQALVVGLLANIILAGLKTSMGILGHSPALLADGINSTSDAAYYIVVSIFMRFANKPADDEHPYGHTQLQQQLPFSGIRLISFTIYLLARVTFKEHPGSPCGLPCSQCC